MAVHPVHAWIDPAHAPVYHLVYPNYDPSDPHQLAKYAAEHKALYSELATWTKARRRAYGFTIDLSHVRSSAMSRQRAIQYCEQVKQRGSPYMACRAFIAPNDEVRGVITALFWQSPPDYPHQFFANVFEARTWAREQTLQLDIFHTRAVAR